MKSAARRMTIWKQVERDEAEAAEARREAKRRKTAAIRRKAHEKKARK